MSSPLKDGSPMLSGVGSIRLDLTDNSAISSIAALLDSSSSTAFEDKMSHKAAYKQTVNQARELCNSVADCSSVSIYNMRLL